MRSKQLIAMAVLLATLGGGHSSGPSEADNRGYRNEGSGEPYAQDRRRLAFCCLQASKGICELTEPMVVITPAAGDRERCILHILA
ncbi:MAG: hypothetical protein O6930_06370 [Gammaproteobacteria bacterium]|nr:hypothetical protein [Gammaproteobacteria bacterium]